MSDGAMEPIVTVALCGTDGTDGRLEATEVTCSTSPGCPLL